MLERTVEQGSTKTQYRLRPQGAWTYEDWLNFPDDGWKYEIIDGVLHMTPPPAIKHQSSSIGLAARMYTYAQDYDLGVVLEAPCGVRLPTQPVPLEPDIFFVKKERLKIIQENYVEGAPDLIVEILSPSSANYDRKKKFEVYQNAGVPEYWLVDYHNRTVEIFHISEGSYQLSGKYDMGDTAESEQLAGFEIAVKTIFDF